MWHQLLKSCLSDVVYDFLSDIITVYVQCAHIYISFEKILYAIMHHFRFLQHPTSHWLEILEGCSFPYGPINNMQEVFSDPQVHHVRCSC